MINSDESGLAFEAAVLGKYVLGTSPNSDVLARYQEAQELLFPLAPSGPDASLMNLALRRPALLPYLDAGAALFWGQSVLRKKLFILAAIAEATPRYAAQFLPLSLPPLVALVRLAGFGMKAGAKLMIGIPLIYWVRGIQR